MVMVITCTWQCVDRGHRRKLTSAAALATGLTAADALFSFEPALEDAYQTWQTPSRRQGWRVGAVIFLFMSIVRLVWLRRLCRGSLTLTPIARTASTNQT